MSANKAARVGEEYVYFLMRLHHVGCQGYSEGF